MPLADEHLLYPRRVYGMDQPRYAWRPSQSRPKVTWPRGAAVAAMVVVPIEHHTLAPSGRPFKAPGAMVTPYPDLRHYTSRDYGSRVGAFRILDALARANVRATFAIGSDALQRHRPLVEAVVEAGHEVAAYGRSPDHIHWSGLAPGEEAQWVRSVRESFDAAGLKPRAWLSPARQQSFETLDLIAQAGFDVCLDWEQDETPTPMATAHGFVTAAPLSNELDDRLLLIERRQSEDAWAAQILEARDHLKREAPRFGGRVLGFTLTPYVTGQPFRIAALRRVLDELGLDTAVWSAGACEIADAAAAGG